MKIVGYIGRWVVWIFTAAIALVVFCYLILAGVNFNDQPASTSAIYLEQVYASREPVADDANAYVYLLGFSVGPGEDPAKMGKQRIAWSQEVIKQPSVETDLVFPGDDYEFRMHNASVINDLLSRCKIIDPDCMNLIEQNQASILDWVQTSKWITARYKNLVSRSAWFESVPYDLRLPLPRYSDVLDAQMLLFANAWIAAGEADSATVKNLLDADLQFWRQVLASSDILITKMIAVAAINNSFSWSGIILRRLPADRVKESIPDSWTLPLSDQERSMLRCMVGEWKFSDSINHWIKEQGGVYPLNYSAEVSIQDKALWLVLKPLLKQQASSNQYADLILKIENAVSVPYQQFPSALARAKAIWVEGRVSMFPDVAYNLTGNYLLAVDDWFITEYLARVADLEGVRQLALAMAEIRSREVAVSKV